MSADRCGSRTDRRGHRPEPDRPELKESAGVPARSSCLFVADALGALPRLKKGMDARYGKIRGDHETADADAPRPRPRSPSTRRSWPRSKAEARQRIDAARQTLEAERTAALAEANAAHRRASCRGRRRDRRRQSGRRSNMHRRGCRRRQQPCRRAGHRSSLRSRRPSPGIVAVTDGRRCGQ